MVPKPEIPSPVGNGWELGEGDFIFIKWNHVKPAPDEVLQLIFCTCPRKCVPDGCPSVDNGLQCADACVKEDCGNYLYFSGDIDYIESDFLSSDDDKH